MHALYVLAVTTGMREAEMLGLTWEDVDLEIRSTRRSDRHQPEHGGVVGGMGESHFVRRHTLQRVEGSGSSDRPRPTSPDEPSPSARRGRRAEGASNAADGGADGGWRTG
jgi:integrase